MPTLAICAQPAILSSLIAHAPACAIVGLRASQLVIDRFFCVPAGNPQGIAAITPFLALEPLARIAA